MHINQYRQFRTRAANLPRFRIAHWAAKRGGAASETRHGGSRGGAANGRGGAVAGGAGDGAGIELSVHCKIKVKGRNSCAEPLPILFIEAETKLDATLQLIQILIRQIIRFMIDTVLPSLLAEKLAAPPLPRDVAGELTHG